MPDPNSAPPFLPTQFLNSAPTLKLGDIEIRGIAAVRRRSEDVLIKDPFQPLILHVQTLFERLRDPLVRQLLGVIRTPGATGELGSVVLQWLRGEGLNVVKVNNQTVYDLWPIPGLQEVYYDYTPGGGSSGRATFYIPDYGLAEAIIYILQEAALKGDKIFQIYLPVLTVNGQKTTWALTPSISGPITRLTVNEWPFSITVHFGDALRNAAQETASPEEGSIVSGKSGKEVLEAILKRIGVVPIYWPPAGPSELTDEPPGGVVVDIAGRPYVDVIEDLLRTYGLAWRWISSGFLPPILIVYRAGDEPEINQDFLNEFVNNLPSKLASLIDFFGATRNMAGKLGLLTVGFANVLAPVNVDPYQAQTLAKLYKKEEEAGASFLKSVVNLAIGGAEGVNYPLPILETLAKLSLNAVKKISQNVAHFNWAPILDIEEFSFSLPTAQDIEGGAIGSPFALTQTVTAQEAAQRGAANVRHLGGGRYEVEGIGTVDANTPLLFAPSTGVGAPRVIGPAGGNPLATTGEGGNTPFYPYSLTVKIPPYAGVWAGLPTLIVGMRPLDGWWESYRAEYVLNSEEQYITLHLRTNRVVAYF